jgi:prepilin-type processing-associated H-X9-DG protein
MAIAGILLALIIPAIAATRETARRMDCQHRLRELALACHAFHEQHRSLPPQRAITLSTVGLQPPGAISCWGQLLPQLGQRPLYDRINFLEDGSGTAADPPFSLVNNALIGVPVAGFVCPSDAVVPGGCSYRACLGSTAGPPFRHHKGAFHSQGLPTPLATFGLVTDGLSQTALCSERSAGDRDPLQFHSGVDVAFAEFTPSTDPEDYRRVCESVGPTGTVQHVSFAGETWLLNGYANVWYNHVESPNSRNPDCTNGGYGVAQGQVTARSRHRGGVNVAFCDGSVRLVAASISLPVWRAMGTRAAADQVSE